MKFLIVGLGSMGKRRIRCLKRLKYNNIAGFDLRSDRRSEVKDKYNIPVFNNALNAIKELKPDVMIISVPPDAHHIYMLLAAEQGIHFFVEASVVDTSMKKIISLIDKANIVGIPSATLLYHPAVNKIKELITNKNFGKISNLIYHSGQYLPDWHSHEKVSDYYVSNPETGGCREIVPFELTWIIDLLGFPVRVCAQKGKSINIEGAELIDDTYNILLGYNNMLATITVDVVSRKATRNLLINFENTQLRWDWNNDYIEYYDSRSKKFTKVYYSKGNAEKGYNENIDEYMYVNELSDFIKTVKKGKVFKNTLKKDHDILKLLYCIEKSSNTNKYVNF